MCSFLPASSENGMIQAHAIESDLDIGCPSEVVAAIDGENLEIHLYNI